MTSPDQLTRFRDVSNPAFRSVAANIATTGRSQVPGHTDVIATDVDPTLTPGQDENAVLQALWSFLGLLARDSKWTALAPRKTVLKETKKTNFAGFKKSGNLAELEPKKSIETSRNGQIYIFNLPPAQ